MADKFDFKCLRCERIGMGVFPERIPSMVCAFCGPLEEMSLEEKIAFLQGGKPNHLNITFNEHWSDHMSVEDAALMWDGDEFVSDKDFKKCIEADSRWQIQWYPNTTVGFYMVSASSLVIAVNSLIHAKMRDCK